MDRASRRSRSKVTAARLLSIRFHEVFEHHDLPRSSRRFGSAARAVCVGRLGCGWSGATRQHRYRHLRLSAIFTTQRSGGSGNSLSLSSSRVRKITKPGKQSFRRFRRIHSPYLACLAPGWENPTDVDRRFDRCLGSSLSATFHVLLPIATDTCVALRINFEVRESYHGRSVQSKQTIAQFTPCPQIFLLMHNCAVAYPRQKRVGRTLGERALACASFFSWRPW
jgi:hypothetical protein